MGRCRQAYRRFGRLPTSSTSPFQPKRPGRIAHICVLRDLVAWHGWWVSPKVPLSAVRSRVSVSVKSGGQNRYSEFGRCLGGLEVWNSYCECWRFVHVLGTYHLQWMRPQHTTLSANAGNFRHALRVSSLALDPKYVCVWHTFDTAARNRVWTSGFSGTTRQTAHTYMMLHAMGHN